MSNPALRAILSEGIFSELSPPTKSCHGSTLVALPGGQMGCAWFGGEFEGDRHTAIWWSQRDGHGWSTATCIADVGAEPHWNPVLHLDGEHLYLFFKVGIYPKRWRTYASSRALTAVEWSEPRELVAGDVGGRGPVKNKILRLGDGAWLAPASLERDEGWDCFVDRSVDRGSTWEQGPFVPLDRESLRGPGIIQPSLWESSPGRLHLLARSSEGRVYRADSDDGGRTWSQAYPISVPNNNCGIDVLRLVDGALILVGNPVGEPWGPRTPLSMFLSRDNGVLWEEAWVLESEPGEYSYPAIVSTPGGFAVSYTWQRRRIQYRVFGYGP